MEAISVHSTKKPLIFLGNHLDNSNWWRGWFL